MKVLNICKLSPAIFESICLQASRAVMVDDRPRIWLNPATSTGLLFSCRQGEVRVFAFFMVGFRKLFIIICMVNCYLLCAIIMIHLPYNIYIYINIYLYFYSVYVASGAAWRCHRLCWPVCWCVPSWSGAAMCAVIAKQMIWLHALLFNASWGLICMFASMFWSLGQSPHHCFTMQ